MGNVAQKSESVPSPAAAVSELFSHPDTAVPITLQTHVDTTNPVLSKYRTTVLVREELTLVWLPYPSWLA